PRWPRSCAAQPRRSRARSCAPPAMAWVARRCMRRSLRFCKTGPRPSLARSQCWIASAQHRAGMRSRVQCLGYKLLFPSKRPAATMPFALMLASLAMLLRARSFHVLRGAAGPERLGVPDAVVLARGLRADVAVGEIADD